MDKAKRYLGRIEQAINGFSCIHVESRGVRDFRPCRAPCRGVQNQRESAVLEVVCGYQRPRWSPVHASRVVRFVWNTPSARANSLAVLTWKDVEGPTPDECSGPLLHYGENLSSSLVSAVEKLTRSLQQLRGDQSGSPPARARISAVGSRGSSTQERGCSGYAAWMTLCFYLCDHGEDVRKWDEESTSTPRAQERELRSQTGVLPRELLLLSPAAVPRRSRRADLPPDPNEGTWDSCLREVSSRYCEQG